jgi:hypothetical protein
MNHSSVKPQTVMVNNITSHNNMNHSSVKHETVMGVVLIVVAVILLTITVSCLTEEWFILLWLAILLTITV